MIVDDDLLAVLRDPDTLPRLDPQRATDVIARARACDVIGRLGARALRSGAASRMDERMRGALEAPMIAAEAYQRLARFETSRLRRAIGDLVPRIVLLKGSAYVVAGLDVAEGRSLSDVDILVPRDTLDAVEQRLLASGWAQIKTDAYDQRYFREWMHELPPLRHRERNTVVDIHHTILPLTSRLKPDPRLLLADAVPLPDSPGVAVLSPADMVLHNVVHHFQDGEFRHSLRELVDLDDLLRHFAPQPGFWPLLLERIERFGFGRPAFYALRHAERLLATPIPGEVTSALSVHAPPPPLLAAMDLLMPACLRMSGRPARAGGEKIAARLLYLRAQWLKMPPALLARHALGKAVNRFRRRTTAETVKA
jgi:hypothetical protein